MDLETAFYSKDLLPSYFIPLQEASSLHVPLLQDLEIMHDDPPKQYTFCKKKKGGGDLFFKWNFTTVQKPVGATKEKYFIWPPSYEICLEMMREI